MAKTKNALPRPALFKYRPQVETLEGREAPGNSTLGPAGFINPMLLGAAGLAVSGSPMLGSTAVTAPSVGSSSSSYSGFTVGGQPELGSAGTIQGSTIAPTSASSSSITSSFFSAPPGIGVPGPSTVDAGGAGDGFGSISVTGGGGTGDAGLTGGSVETGGSDPLTNFVMTGAPNSAPAAANAPTAFTGEYIHTANTDMFWAVMLQPGVDAGLFAAAAGGVNHGSAGALANTFMIKFPEGASAQSIQQSLEANPNVIWAEQQVRRQVTTNAVPNDPLFPFQWHLRNTAQLGGLPGADANVVPVWDEFQGRGVTIGIVDSGVEYTHEDLAPNFDFSTSFDFTENDFDPWWRSDDDGAAHGTSVAGVAAGRSNNGVGIAGAAPLSNISGLKLIDGTGITDFMIASSQSWARNVIDIYNNSWGKADPDAIVYQSPLLTATFQDGAQFGRNGLGNIWVWSAGNSHEEGSSANYDATKSNQYAINVGALTEFGTKSGYSEEGTNLFVSAYSNGGFLGITTTDIFNGYTFDFGGTSSAAPLVSGVIALMLEANPNLTWRDVKAIIARTARKTDPNDPSWTTNSAGLHYSTKYGYGAIDAKAAVDMARTWNNLPQQVIPYETDSMVVNLTIPSNLNGMSRSFIIPQNFTVEHVEVVFTAVHESLGQITLDLTSPAGTNYTVPPLLANEEEGAFINYPFGFTGYQGEQSQGTWTLRVRDIGGVETGQWIRWQLRIYGYQDGGVAPPVLPGFDSNGSHDRRYEPNNSYRTSSNLGSLIGNDVRINNLAIASRTDRDWFRIRTTRAGNFTAEIGITGDPILHIRMFIWDARARRLIEVGKGQGTELKPGGIQRVTWNANVGDLVFVQVFGYNRATGNYNLRLSQV